MYGAPLCRRLQQAADQCCATCGLTPRLCPRRLVAPSPAWPCLPSLRSARLDRSSRAGVLLNAISIFRLSGAIAVVDIYMPVGWRILHTLHEIHQPIAIHIKFTNPVISAIGSDDHVRVRGAALLEHYVCVISPVEDESLSPDVVRVMSVSVRWPWRSGLHDAAGILVPDGTASRPQNRHCSTATADAAPLRRL